jgi:hypothetical protein
VDKFHRAKVGLDLVVSIERTLSSLAHRVPVALDLPQALAHVVGRFANRAHLLFAVTIHVERELRERVPVVTIQAVRFCFEIVADVARMAGDFPGFVISPAHATALEARRLNTARFVFAVVPAILIVILSASRTAFCTHAQLLEFCIDMVTVIYREADLILTVGRLDCPPESGGDNAQKHDDKDGHGLSPSRLITASFANAPQAGQLLRQSVAGPPVILVRLHLK